MPDQATVQSPATNRNSPDDQSKYTIKVGGEEKEVTLEQLKELAQKGDDYTNKTKLLAEQKREIEQQRDNVRDLVKLREEITANPALQDRITQLINDARTGKPISEKKIDRTQKMLDQEISSIDDSTDEGMRTKVQLQRLRQIISEESGTSTLQQKVEELEQKIAFLEKKSTVGIEAQLNSRLTELKNDFGKELVDKYKGDIVSLARKYPDYLTDGKFVKLLYNFASDEELEKALLSRAESRKKSEIERKKRGSDTIGDSLNTGQLQHKKDRFGRTNIRDLVSKSVEKARGLI